MGEQVIPPVKSSRQASNKGVALPPPREDLKALTMWARSVQEILETGERRTANEGDSNVKVKDLKDANFLRQHTNLSGAITQSDLDGLFDNQSPLWNEAVQQLIDRVNSYDPEARIKGSMSYKLRESVDATRKYFKMAAERIEEYRDEFETANAITTASIISAATEHAGSACKINDMYLTPAEFYAGVKGLSEGAVAAKAEVSFHGFEYDCTNEGGQYINNAALTRTLDEQQSTFEDFLSGKSNSSEYSQFIDTVATDSETWARFSQVLRSDFGLATKQEVSSSIDQLDSTFAGRACYSEAGHVIRANGPDECDRKGGYWLMSSTAGRLVRLKAQIYNEIGADLEQFQEVVATDLRSMATQITTLNSKFNGNRARIEQVAETVTDAETELAQVQANLSTTNNKLSQKLALNKYGSYYSLTSEVKGKLGGLQFTNDGSTASMIVDANNFLVGSGALSGAKAPFRVSGNTTYLQNVEIEGYLKATGISKMTTGSKGGMSVPNNQWGSGSINYYVLGYVNRPYGASEWAVQVTFTAHNSHGDSDDQDFAVDLYVGGVRVSTANNTSSWNIGLAGTGGRGGITADSAEIKVGLGGYNSKGSASIFWTALAIVEKQ